ncbi:MAG: Rrf2 family transcriptional regulator [Litorimonas sp.]
MRLPLHVDYALRMLMQLGVQDQRLTTIAQTANTYGISKNHLMKVAHNLRQLGYVEAIRGRSGGLKLAMPAEDINIGRFVRDMEAGSALVECFPGGSGGCLITPSCRLKGMLANAMEAFYESLGQFTLADLINSNAPLREALLLDVK